MIAHSHRVHPGLCPRPGSSLDNRGRRRGLGLPEAMIALAVSLTLLTAVGAAFNASTAAINVNDDFLRASQTGRVALARVLYDIRNGAIDELSTNNSLRMITNKGQDITYKLVDDTDPRSAPRRLVLVNNTTGQSHTLARNVTTVPVTDSRPFATVLGKDSNNTDCVKRVTVYLSIRVGSNEVHLSGAAAPRRNLTY